MAHLRNLIKVDTVRYQRNGSAGTGFYAVSFRYREGKSWTPMVAVVQAPDELTGFNDKAVSVICPSRPQEGWDGPYFGPILVEACQRACDSGSAYGLGEG